MCSSDLLEEVAAFLKDTRADAYERLVESFLASPRYGERWGRHWLDIVGYADSNGYFSADSDRPLAWKFRDYVVRSINADKPLDRFIQEQLAADQLKLNDSKSLAALGFLSPILCAAAMGLSDLVVIGNALRLRRWRL